MTETRFTIDSEQAMQAFGQKLTTVLPPQAVITLSGDLGAGKSVLARAILHALGYAGTVPSPTYTLVESYRLADRRVAHLDLYRLVDPGELYDLGFDDVVAEHDLLLIEWPEQGGSLLPPATVAIRIDTVNDEQRRVVLRADAGLSASLI